MTQTDFDVNAIDPHAADELRAKGGPRYVAESHPGYPCRQCLRDAQVAEELILVSHDPFTTDSPYRSASPIFLHRFPCPPHPLVADLPLQLTRRQLSVRAFNEAEMMLDAEVIDGSALEATIRRYFSETASHHIHVHNASRGCWAARIDRRNPDRVS